MAVAVGRQKGAAVRNAVCIARIRIVAPVNRTVAGVVGSASRLHGVTGGQNDDGKYCQHHAGDVLEVGEIDAHKNWA